MDRATTAEAASYWDWSADRGASTLLRYAAGLILILASWLVLGVLVGLASTLIFDALGLLVSLSLPALIFSALHIATTGVRLLSRIGGSNNRPASVSAAREGSPAGDTGIERPRRGPLHSAASSQGPLAWNAA